MLETRFPRVAVVRNSDEPRLRTGRQPRRGDRDGGRRDRARQQRRRVRSRTSWSDCSRRSPTPRSAWSQASCCRAQPRSSSTPRGSSSTRRCGRGTCCGTVRSTRSRTRRSRSVPAAAPPPTARSAFVELGGFDERFFAYWEDVDLALRFRLAGWRCVRAPGARALHHHGATLGAASPRPERLEAYGRAYVLAKYRVARSGMLMRLKIAALDWPVLVVHALVRRELGAPPRPCGGASRRPGGYCLACTSRACDRRVSRGDRPSGEPAATALPRWATTAFPRARAAEFSSFAR